MTATTKRSLAVLVGNGLSIAFNPELGLSKITREVMERIRNATDTGDDVVRAMQELAERAIPEGPSSEEDFEKLVGAFGAESQTLKHLDRLAELTAPKDAELRAAIRRVVELAEKIRDTGISHVLEVIFERSRGHHDRAQGLHALVQTIVSEFAGEISFGNLNYDTLLLSALLNECQSDLADLAHGYNKVKVTIEGGNSFTTPALRTRMSDFPPNRRVRLLHLHGSLTYWATRDGVAHAKLTTDELDELSQWNSVREDDTNIRPSVVLVTQRDKASAVEKFPFTLAYEAFRGALNLARDWLIIGYSFRDQPVNEMLADAFMSRDPKPSVFLVTYGDKPGREEVERALGWGVEDGASDEWLTIDRNGADGLEARAAWKQFVSCS